ncbi:MAG: vWA domain-containing protein, partial [Bacteroidota bacterium]
MSDLHLSFSFHPAFLLGAALGAFLLAWFTYRVTVPPVSRLLRILLATARGLALFLLMLFIGEPLLSLLRRTIDPPTTVVLIDDSRSMSIKDRAGERGAVLRDLLQSDAFRTLESVGAVRHALFSTRTRFLDSFSPDSLSLGGDGTDIAAALKRIKEAAATANIQAVVLVTDGNVTVGSSPAYEAEELGIPVFTVGVGDTSEQRDLLIRKVLTNAITYAGSKVPVNETLKSSGFGGERVEVTLHDVSGVLDRRVVSLGSGTREYAVPLSMIPQKEGTQKITVEVSRLKDELAYENNRSSFFTKVLKSRIRVLLIAGAPSVDVAFVRRALEADENVEVTSLIERGREQFYETAFSPALLHNAECLVLIGFPTGQTSAGVLTAVADAANNGKPMFFMMSRTMDFSKLRILEPHLPFSVQGGTPLGGSQDEYQAFFVVHEAQRNNALLKLAGANDAEPWSRLAPIYKLQMSFRTKPEAEILATTRVQNVTTNDPFLASRNINQKKSLALLGYGIWRWNMLTEPVSASGTVLEEFLSNAIRWLTTREDDRRVRVQAARETFAGQEPIEFIGQVYDENYRPVDDAQVLVTVTRGRSQG